jgi:hypothetical protein
MWGEAEEDRLLSLSGTWLPSNTASAALLAAPRSVCRRWARAIYPTWPALEGLYVPSTLTGHPNIVLWIGAADSISTMPSFSRRLTQPLVWSIAQAAAAEIGYHILNESREGKLRQPDWALLQLRRPGYLSHRGSCALNATD